MLDQCVEGFYEARFEPGLEPGLEAVADIEAKAIIIIIITTITIWIARGEDRNLKSVLVL